MHADLGTSIAIWTVVPIVTAIALTFVIMAMVRKRLSASGVGLSGRPTKERQQKAADLQATGRKARATILSVQPTGMILNHINLECQVGFRVEYIDGGGSFDGTKRMMVSQAAMPRVGDVWPAWVDRADPSVFAVGQVAALDASQIEMFREFGIAHPLDATARPSTPSPMPPPQAPSTTVDHVAELERLAALHRSGALTDSEFAREKARVLGA